MSDTIPPHNALPMGHQLQEYIIQFVLGDGGFGITYLAKDTQLNALVAIKEYLPNELAVRESNYTVQAKSEQQTKVFKWGLDRFLEEARILAQFKHPNIVRVLRFFKAHNTAYIVMEYEQGQSLADAVDQKGTAATQAELMALLPPLLDALETVHNAGYLHRDIKPDNIYLRDEDSSPVLLDFGAARFDVGRRSRSVTSIVTPGYAPFEQYENDGSQQGAWTDIYALGAVLYYLIWGIKPVAATKRISVTMRGKPDPLTPLVEIGKGKYADSFLQAIDLALKIKQEDRPQNVSVWRTQLLLFSEANVSSSTSQKMSKKREKAGFQFKWYYGAAILLGLVVIGGGYSLFKYLEKQPNEQSRHKTTASNDYLEVQRQQIDVEKRRLDVARVAAAREAERLEQNLAQAREVREAEKQRQYIQIAQHDAAEIGRKIWNNESSGKISGFTVWNKQEQFASLGIGHFIWYPQGDEGPFTETFPDLLKFMQKHGVILPDWLQKTPDCPWNTRQEFMDRQQSEKMISLRTLMKNTVPVQVQFMIRRLELALPKILETLPTETQRKHVREQFHRVTQAPKGIYALLDYVHFKGEGISSTERYQDQGWGLLQVLEQMLGDSANATEDFVEAAEFVLKRRIQNSPPERNEIRWLQGWFNRLNTYR
jgi:serine/threonine protein kinase